MFIEKRGDESHLAFFSSLRELLQNLVTNILVKDIKCF